MGREREREGEKHQCMAASHVPPACALTGNQTGDPLVHRLALSPLSHTSQGTNSFSNTLINPLLLTILPPN